jgi:hypothetical protein
MRNTSGAEPVGTGDVAPQPLPLRRRTGGRPQAR